MCNFACWIHRHVRGLLNIKMLCVVINLNLMTISKIYIILKLHVEVILTFKILGIILALKFSQYILPSPL
jgi:hypothetical protein